MLPLDTITAVARETACESWDVAAQSASTVTSDSDASTFMPATANHDIERYLKTGDYDPHFAGWPGDFMDRARLAESELKQALIAEVRRRTTHATAREIVANVDVVGFTRRKVEPMVRGLFARAEQEAVLAMLEQSVVFLGSANIFDVIAKADWLHTARHLANLFLVSADAELLDADAPNLVGLSEETTCYVSMTYFDRGGRFEDFLVHEAAHVFHNCKRHTVGLPETRRREWLLDIEFRKRETFAYACEAYSRLLELGQRRSSRKSLLLELTGDPAPLEGRVDRDEYVDILREAVSARNGWKRILARCAPQRR